MTIEITTLDSGLRIVTDTMRELETASVGVWIDTGSRSETAPEQGLAHFLEHMLFKGTRTRSAQDIAEAIEAVGGDINGSTSVENTAYQARVLAADTGLALEIIGDILTSSVFDPEEIAREKSVILQEIGETQDTPDDLVFDHFSEAAYPGQPFGRSILGTPERVSAFSRPMVQNYLARNYTQPGIVVSAAGAVRHAEIVGHAQKHFAKLPHEKPVASAPAVYRGGEARLKRKLEQTHVVVGFEAPSFHDPSTYASNVFASAIGGGLASRLFQEVREKRGLAYSIYSFYWGYSDTGIFGFHASCAHKDALELVSVSLDCLAEGVRTLTETEMRRACASMKLSLLTGLESPAARADQIARQILAFGRVLTRAEIVGKIDALTLDEVRRAGETALASQPTVAVVGDIRHAPNPAAVRQRLNGM